jgi:Cu/Ag efflux protein CusF
LFKEKRRWLVLLLVLLLALSLPAACAKKTKSYQGVGTIEEIDKQQATMQINHEAIEGYMPAMSMPYRVKDASLLESVKPGDRVEFSIEDGSSGILVTAVKKVAK